VLEEEGFKSYESQEQEEQKVMHIDRCVTVDLSSFNPN
jgi:hypothetical protein